MIELYPNNGGKSIRSWVPSRPPQLFGYKNQNDAGQIKCLGTDLSVDVSNSTEKLIFNTLHTHTTTYTNNGQTDVTDIPVSDYVSTNNRHVGTISVPFENVVTHCEASGGAVCPEEKNFFSSWSLWNPSSGIQFKSETKTKMVRTFNWDRYYYHATYIPSLPAGSSVKFVTTYTPALPLSPKNPDCPIPKEQLLDSDGVAEVKNSFGQFQDSLTSNNTKKYTQDTFRCIDLWINTKLDKPNPMPGEDLVLDFIVGNAGGATAEDSLLETQIPGGFTDFDLSKVTCIPSAGAVCATPTYDATTGKFSAIIPSIPKNGTITYRLSGKAVDYSSSWDMMHTLTE